MGTSPSSETRGAGVSTWTKLEGTSPGFLNINLCKLVVSKVSKKCSLVFDLLDMSLKNKGCPFFSGLNIKTKNIHVVADTRCEL